MTQQAVTQTSQAQRYIDLLMTLAEREDDPEVRHDLLERLDRVMLLERIERVLGLGRAELPAIAARAREDAH